MIKYTSGGVYFLFKICQLSGSVFPHALIVALPCAVITAALTVCIQRDYIHFLTQEDSVLKDNSAWAGFSFLVGFLIVFRTSQSYNRFWDGCTSTHHMRAEWFDGCSSLLAFCRHSKAEKELIGSFQNTLVRLFSMLHAAALGEIEDSCSEAPDEWTSVEAFKFELIDVEGIDEESLKAVKDSHAKVELIFQWIQQLIVENISTGVLSIPPPILSRSFQEIANGMVAFHDAMKISYIPFPFPYAQTCDFLLLLHWIVGPFVVSQWVTDPFWGFVFSFTQIFILWALNFIAVELENPFGMDANDIDGKEMQQEMNEHLLLLMRPGTQRTPILSDKVQDLSSPLTHNLADDSVLKQKSFCDVWHSMANGPEPVARRFSVATNRRSIREGQKSRGSMFRPSIQSDGNYEVAGYHRGSRQSSTDPSAFSRHASEQPAASATATPHSRSSGVASGSGESTPDNKPFPDEHKRHVPPRQETTEDLDEEAQALPLPRVVVLEPMTSKEPWSPPVTEGGWRGPDQEEYTGREQQGSPAPWPSQGTPTLVARGQAGPRIGTKQHPPTGLDPNDQAGSTELGGVTEDASDGTGFYSSGRPPDPSRGERL